MAKERSRRSTFVLFFKLSDARGRALGLAGHRERRGREVGQFRDGVTAEVVTQILRRLLAEQVEFVNAWQMAAQRHIASDGAINGFDDLKQGHLLGIVIEKIATTSSQLRLNDALANQALEDFQGRVGGDIQMLCDLTRLDGLGMEILGRAAGEEGDGNGGMR